MPNHARHQTISLRKRVRAEIFFGYPMHYPMPPSAQEEATLSWFIRALNGLEPKERRELLRQILGTSD